MARYQVQAPDGHTITLDGPEGASDAEIMSQAQKLYQPGQQASAPAPPAAPAKPNSLIDSALSFGQGLVDDALGGADVMMRRAIPLPGGVNLPSLMSQGMALGGRAAEALGAPKGTAAVAGQALAGYAPKTTAGQVSRTAGQIAPAVLAPGSALQRVANVVVPTATTELAGRGAKALGAPQAVVDAARAVGGIAGGLAANARVTGGRPDPAAGMRQAEEALQEAGIDVRSVSQASMGRIGDLIRQGRNPREAAIGVVSTDDLLVPVPTTRGQRTGQPGQQLTENLMLRGARGSAASRQMRGLVSEQQDALRANTAAQADQIAGGQAPTRGQAGEAISSRLNADYDAQKAGVDAAYETARATGEGARLPREQMPILGTNLREAVSSYDLDNVPRVARELNKFDNIAGSGNVTVRDLFDARARLSNLRASNDPVEGSAASAATRALDRHIDDAVTADLFTGDPQSVAAWRTAIQQRRNFGQMFESGDLIEALTERAPRSGNMRALRVDPGDASNYILGRSDLGFVGRQNLHRDVGQLRAVLGENSPEWNSLRAEMFQRFASQGEGAIEFGQRQFSGPKFQKAWQDFNRRDPRLAELMFSPEERAQINRFSMIASRVTSPVKGGDNPSNTAVTAARMLGNLSFLKGVPFVKEFTNSVEAQINLNQATRATSQAPGRAPGQPLRPTLDSSTLRGLNAAAGPNWPQSAPQR